MARFSQVVAVDGHVRLLEASAVKAANAVLLNSDLCHVPLQDGQFDLVLACDVIEHVDPNALLAEARRLARPGGKLLLSVPAFPSLWSAMDERAGHRCRYRRRQLESELCVNGWQPMGFTHCQFLLFPVVFLSRRLGGRAGQTLERTPPRWLNRFLARINRFEARVLGDFSLPFGSSLIVWADAV